MCLQPPSCRKVPHHNTGNRRRRGSAIIEAALMMPWIYFLLVGVFDVGFYCYALMSTANAARVGALQITANGYNYTTAAAEASQACLTVLHEMADLPNVGNTTACSGPVTVSAVCNDYGTPASPNSPAAACVNASVCVTHNCALALTVNYTTLPLIPIPGLLASQFTFAHTAEVQFAN